ncbi:MAG TPA: hypothetical protein VL088_03655 [Pedobacter sp.]|nr:hypothetical protein [Pedobacter sp.]
MKTYLSILALLFVSSITLAQNVSKASDTTKQLKNKATIAKQIQGTTFGEKVNAGLHAAGAAIAQGAAKVQNPLYNEAGNAGDNPMYDPKAKTANKVGPIKEVIVKGGKND